MLLNYLKTGLRSIARQKVPTVINTVGMALAVGCCLVVYTFFDLALRCDDFHEQVDTIAVAHRVLDNNGTPEIWCETPEPFGPALQAETPEVEQTCRLSVRNGLVREADGDVFKEKISFVDTSFFKVFSFKLKWGREEDFKGQDALVLSLEMAEKYFGAENPVGQRIAIRFTSKGQSYENQYRITGVAEKIPFKSSFDFRCLIPFENQLHLGQPDFSDWKKAVEATFIKMRRPNDIDKIRQAASRMVAVQNQADPEAPVKAFGFIPLNTITTEGAELKRSIFNSAHPSSLILLAGIAIAMLLLVCFNYINIAMAAATGRLREISVRKVMGSAQRQIIMQFLVENALVCLAALAGGLVLAQALFLPWFKRLTGMEELRVEGSDPLVWLFLTGLLVVTVLGGAAYPAFYISSLKPLSIFKNKIKLGEQNLLRRLLVGLQFVLTFVTLFAATVMINESPKLKAKSWGYQQQDLLVLRLPDGKAFDALKNEVLRLPNTLSAAGSGVYFGGGYQSIPVETEGQTVQINELVAGRGYLETLDLPLAAGTSFQTEGSGTTEKTALVNTTFRRKLGWDKVEGKTLRLGGQQYQIVGETPDFHYDGFDERIQPAVILLCTPEELRYLTVRVRPGSAVAAMPGLQALWKQHFPNDPVQIFYQNAVFDGYFRGYNNITSLMTATASLAILLSAFGIFGLAMLRMFRRVREFSIRRVLGAGAWHFGWLVSSEFVGLLLVASVLGMGVGFVLMKAIMEMFAPGHAMAPVLPAISTLGLLLMVTLGACGFHLWRLWRVNPVNTLKDE